MSTLIILLENIGTPESPIETNVKGIVKCCLIQCFECPELIFVLD